MSLTLPELKQRLAERDIVELVELLQLTPETLVEIADDYIEENFDLLVELTAEADFSPEYFDQ